MNAILAAKKRCCCGPAGDIVASFACAETVRVVNRDGITERDALYETNGSFASAYADGPIGYSLQLDQYGRQRLQVIGATGGSGISPVTVRTIAASGYGRSKNESFNPSTGEIDPRFSFDARRELADDYPTGSLLGAQVFVTDNRTPGNTFDPTAPAITDVLLGMVPLLDADTSIPDGRWLRDRLESPLASNTPANGLEWLWADNNNGSGEVGLRSTLVRATVRPDGPNDSFVESDQCTLSVVGRTLNAAYRYSSTAVDGGSIRTETRTVSVVADVTVRLPDDAPIDEVNP